MFNGDFKLLVTLGPSSLKKSVIQEIDNDNVYLFRINMSHTPIDQLEKSIRKIQQYTDKPICIDSEGAQIRNGSMLNGGAVFIKGEHVKIHYSEIAGDKNNISFTPNDICRQIDIGDVIKIDFNSTQIKVTDKNKKYCTAIVESGGKVGSNKATDIINKKTLLDSITIKDRSAVEIAKKNSVKHFALSFASSEKEVKQMREIVGKDSVLISKIESLEGLHNIEGILDASDEILIDRGDLSRQISLEKIPFLQRRIISIAKSKSVPVFVATNLLESMTISKEPTRAEINDVVSTLLMGADGLVLAAETAIGDYPLEVVRMINKLAFQTKCWTPNSSIEEILNNGKKCEEILV